MGLSNDLNTVQADLVSNLTLVSPGVLDKVTFRTGDKSLTQMDVPPRIVWVRVPGLYTAAQQGRRKPTTTSRILRTHEAHVEAHVWAAENATTKDDSDCELLAHTMVASLYRCLHGSFEVAGDAWPQPAWLKQGYVTVVSFLVHIPVIDAPPMATVTATADSFPFDQSMTPIPPGVLQAPGDDDIMPPPPPPPGALPLGATDNTAGGAVIVFDANVPSWNRSAPPSGVNTYELPADTTTTEGRTIGWLSGLPPVVIAPEGWLLFNPLKGGLASSYTYADAPGEVYTWWTDVLDKIFWPK